MSHVLSFDAKRHQEKIHRVEEHVAQHKAAFAKHPWREHYHFQPPVGWMNDPHGLIQFQGKFHLFYQHNPFSGKWATMHWGHAISADLMHWEHQPEALAPSEDYDDWEGGGIFTGSAIEHQNELILFYTGCAKDRQVQCMASSTDGLNFTKSDHNPVLAEPPPEIDPHDFRDPKVWKQGNIWYMVTGVSTRKSNSVAAKDREFRNQGKVCLHRSTNLKNWEFVNYLVESSGELGTMLECPNFFPLDGKWVLMFSPMGLQDRQVIYLTGDFDVQNGNFQWQTMGSVDLGFDFYAPQHFRDEKGRDLIMAWVGSWPWMPWYRGSYETERLGWCGSLTLPRQIRLCPDGKLASEPVQEVEQLRGQEQYYAPCVIEESKPFSFAAGDGVHCEVIASFDLSETNAQYIVFRLRGSAQQETKLEFDLAKGEMIFDRTRSGNISALQRKCLLESASQSQLTVRIFLDSISIEVFTDNGRTTMTNSIFSNPESNELSISTVGGKTRLLGLRTYGLKSTVNA
jgi:beta-fructofuranosidase